MTNHGRGGGGRRAGLVEPGCQPQYSATTEIAVGACTTGAKQFLSLAIELYRTYGVQSMCQSMIHTQAPRPRCTIDGSRTAVLLSAERRKPCYLLCRSSPDRVREHAARLGFRDEDVSHAPAAVVIYRSVGCAPSRDTKVQQLVCTYLFFQRSHCSRHSILRTEQVCIYLTTCLPSHREAAPPQ